MTALFALTVIAYLVAAVVFSFALMAPRERPSYQVPLSLSRPKLKLMPLERAGALALTASLVLHAAYVAVAVNHSEESLTAQMQIHTALSLTAFVLAAGFLLFWMRRAPALGSLVASLSLIWFAMAAVRGPFLRSATRSAPLEIPSAILPLHVAGNVLGVASLSVAAIAGVLYLIGEQRLKQKRTSGVFSRLPALGILDRVAHQALLLGLPLFTIGVVTGALWAYRLDPASLHVSFGQSVGVLSWLIFATLLFFRVYAGFRGRRAAWITVLGFAITMVVLFGYVLRSGETDTRQSSGEHRLSEATS